MIPDYILSQLEAKAIAAGQWLEDWRITPMQHRANVLKMWVRRPERAEWYAGRKRHRGVLHGGKP